MADRQLSWLAVFAVGAAEFVAVTGAVVSADLGESFGTIVLATMLGYGLAVVGMAAVAVALFR
ncbi:MAG: hypothetical protein ABEH77_01870 [Halobacteriaceae archaeon]